MLQDPDPEQHLAARARAAAARPLRSGLGHRLHPDAILLRSADMHALEIPASVLAVARAGAGTNNIPVAKLSQRGIPVFNAPGANANAVKELVLAGMFLAARNICQAWSFVRSLEGDDDALEQAVEQGKKKFVGYELPGRTLGVVGLGAIGVEVANAALGLRMKVLGYDPQITVQRAWQLSSGRRAGAEPRRPVRALRLRHRARAAQRPHARPGQRGAHRADAPRQRDAELRPRADRRRAGRARGARWRPARGLHLRLPDQCGQGAPAGRGAAAPRRLDRRGRGELRDHGRRTRCATSSRTATSAIR